MCIVPVCKLCLYYTFSLCKQAEQNVNAGFVVRYVLTDRRGSEIEATARGSGVSPWQQLTSLLQLPVAKQLQL